jgi:hypothetical protein
VLACPTPATSTPPTNPAPGYGLLGQLPLQGCPDALAWFKAAARWPQSPCSKPTTTQASPTNGTTYTRAMRAGSTFPGEQLKAQLYQRPGGLGGPEQDRICGLVDHGPTVGPALAPASALGRPSRR